ncbi:MAG: NADH-quinone oxidoreductase subunit H [Oligoflexia bacterium]|nr:NADH-quinone oxidoreductase subunit H [Oligoflexia bacterium]
MSTLTTSLNILAFLGLSPLFEAIIRKVSARVQARQGPPLVQPYLDLLKLLGRENIDSAGTWPFRLAPLIALASILTVVAVLPLAGRESAFTAQADTITLVYLLTLGGVSVLLGAFASRNPYALIGASREMITMILVEPVLAMVLLLGALKAGSLDLMSALYGAIRPGYGIAVVVMLAVYLLGLQAFVARQPFDIAEAEVEILGGPFIEYSGPNFALFKYYLMIKQMFYAYLPVAIFVPLPRSGFYGVDLLVQLALTGLVFILIGLLAATHPRFRIDQAIRYYAVLFVLAVLALGLSLSGF